ncbi:MAG: hypothetical protein IJY22_07515 [Clostridia bacterium]|nr:hypothetical protein [Clostridia bacterium]
MSGSVWALFCVCIGATLLEIALPDGEREGPKQFLRFFTALVVLLLVLEPVLSFAKNVNVSEGVPGFGEEVEFEETFSDAVEKRSRLELEMGIYALLAEEFALEREHCTVTAILDDEGELTCIRVKLCGKGLLQDPDEIEARLRELFSCEMEVR